MCFSEYCHKSLWKRNIGFWPTWLYFSVRNPKTHLQWLEGVWLICNQEHQTRPCLKVGSWTNVPWWDSEVASWSGFPPETNCSHSSVRKTQAYWHRQRDECCSFSTIVCKRAFSIGANHIITNKGSSYQISHHIHHLLTGCGWTNEHRSLWILNQFGLHVLQGTANISLLLLMLVAGWSSLLPLTFLDLISPFFWITMKNFTLEYKRNVLIIQIHLRLSCCLGWKTSTTRILRVLFW